MGKHKHHIIPRYRCKELGIDPDFDENIVEVDRLDHARIHWGYKCDDLEPLFEYITPAQWIIDLIPRGDSRDVGAAVINARGEIDGIDNSGENHIWYGVFGEDHPAYGNKHTEESKRKISEGVKKFRAENPEHQSGKNSGMYIDGLSHTKEWRKTYNKNNSEKHSKRANDWYHDNPNKEELMEQKRVYAREYMNKNRDKVNRKRREQRAKKKAETQGEGNLDPFLRYAETFSHDIPEYPINTHLE